MEERGMGDFLTYKLYLTGWDQSHVRVCESVINLLHPQTKVHNSSLMSFHLELTGFFLSLLPPQATHVMVHFDKDTDVVTGLKQKTHYGRPIWDKEFEQVRIENPT